MDEPMTQAADKLAEDADADVIFYHGDIERYADLRLIEMCAKNNRRSNVILILVTRGGDPHAAYRIAKYLQGKYEKFTLYVSGICKSAGTLVALGAHELVISDHGELGPLDIQMPKKDELIAKQSGLTVNYALNSLQTYAYRSFQEFFIRLEQLSSFTISLPTAARIATDLASGIYGPISGQIDPVHVGEASREMDIADHYGRRLLEESSNFELKSIEKLQSDYPSHHFVIDRREAETLFKNVREPSELERELAEAIGYDRRLPPDTIQLTLEFISTEKSTSSGESDEVGREASETTGTAGSEGERAIEAQNGEHAEDPGTGQSNKEA